MKDVQGIEIEIGDKIAFSGYNETNVRVGTVLSFTAKKVRIQRTKTLTELRDPKRCAIISKDK